MKNLKLYEEFDASDCRDENGITIGLIDSIISVARILRGRDLDNPEVQEAMKDLKADEDVTFILTNQELQ